MNTEAKFPKGKSVSVPAYLREHGNSEAAEEWEKMNEEHGDKFKTARTQKLLTQAIRKTLPPLYSQENEKDPMVWVKFFNPYGRGTWLATEFDGRDTFFGLVDLGHPELGYFSLRELQSLRGPGGAQGIERDAWFKPKPLSQARAQEIRAHVRAADESLALMQKYMEGDSPEEGWDPGDIQYESDIDDDEDSGGSLIPGLELNRGAGAIEGPGIPDGTGPYGGTPECQLWEGETEEDILAGRGAGSIKGPGIPDGTGPHGGTPECPMWREEASRKTAAIPSIIRRHGEFDALVEMMEDLENQVQSGWLDERRAAETIKRDLADELAAGVQMGDVSSRREFQEIERAILEFGKGLLGGRAPTKLIYSRQYLPHIKKLASGKSADSSLAALKRLAADDNDEKEGRFEEGEPADPTKNMSPAEKKKWEEQNKKHRDKFKKDKKAADESLEALERMAMTKTAADYTITALDNMGRPIDISFAKTLAGVKRTVAQMWREGYRRGRVDGPKGTATFDDIRSSGRITFRAANLRPSQSFEPESWAFTKKEAGRAPGGLYGFPKKIQADCERAARKVSKAALRLAKTAYKKDERVAHFLSTHSKRARSLSARVLMAAMKEIGPKVAADKEGARQRVAPGKLASDKQARYGLYGYPAKTANLGITTCAQLKEEAGRVAAGLHGRRANRYEQITGFLHTHSKESRCLYSKLLHRSYPDADMKCASAPQTVREWLYWED